MSEASIQPSLITLSDGSAVLALPAFVVDQDHFPGEAVLSQAKKHVLLLTMQAYGLTLLSVFDAPGVDQIQVLPRDYSWEDNDIDLSLYTKLGPPTKTQAQLAQKTGNRLNDLRDPDLNPFLHALHERKIVNRAAVTEIFTEAYNNVADLFGKPRWDVVNSLREQALLGENTIQSTPKPSSRL